MKKQVLGPTHIPKLAQRMRTWDTVVLDCETTSTDAWAADTEVLGLGVCSLESDEHFYLPIQHHEVQLGPLDLRPVLDILEEKPLIGHDIKFDLHMLGRFGWRPKQELFMDTIVMARLWAYDEHPALDLEYLGKDLVKYEYHTNLKKFRKRLKEFSITYVGNYCIEDIYLTKLLYRFFRDNLSQSLLDLFQRECYLTRDLYAMERRGFMVDAGYAEYARDGLDQRCDALVEDIQKQAKDEDFNPRSPKQVGALMESIGIEPVKKTDAGNASWDRDAMLEVRDQHPVPMNIAKYRALKYQRSGHVQRALTAVELHNEIMHFEFKNWGTVTGRLSGNSQQMPKGWLQFGEEGMGEDLLVWAKGDLAVERDFSIRRLHKPREGHVLLVADYKQIEMFVLGYFINDPTFTKWLDSGNVHAAVALDVWGIDEDHPMFDVFYGRGKVFNFANVYGQGIKALAALNGWTLDEAKGYQQDYSNRMPGLQKYRMQVQRALRRDGFVTNEFLREYHVEPQLAYKAVNYVVQGSSGDHVKWKLTETRELRRQLKCHTLNTTHDDFVFEIPIENVDGIPDLLKILRKSPFKRDLELDVEYSLDNLVELHPYKEGMTIAA